MKKNKWLPFEVTSRLIHQKGILLILDPNEKNIFELVKSYSIFGGITEKEEADYSKKSLMMALEFMIQNKKPSLEEGYVSKDPQKVIFVKIEGFNETQYQEIINLLSVVKGY